MWDRLLVLQLDLIIMILQWKKKVEKLKAQNLFKAAASIVKLSTKFSNNENANDDEEGSEGTTPQDGNRDADNEEDLSPQL
jgi:hypothetical protein